MNNPFKFGKEVSGDQFYDRREISDELYRMLSEGSSNVVMYAPRRYGKTSLVLKVLERFGQDGIPSVHFDVSKVPTLERFLDEYASSVYAIGGKLQNIAHLIEEFVGHLHPTFSIKPSGTCSVRLDYGEKMSASSISQVLELPEKVSEAIGKPIVIAFDEFQEVAELSREFSLEKIFRSVIQAHQRTRYVFFGSKTHLMKRMFGEHSRPFYNSAFNLRMGKPPVEESACYVRDRFRSEGASIAEPEVRRILDLSQNIPYYVQALGWLTFDTMALAERASAKPSDVSEALRRLLESNEDLYEERLRALAPSRRALAEALAAEPTAVFDEKYRSRHGLGVTSTVHSALEQLVDSGMVESDKTGYFIGDPIFSLYIRTSSPAHVVAV